MFCFRPFEGIADLKEKVAQITQTHFNSLPARKEYIEAVLKSMAQGGEFTLKEITTKSGLTRTQTGCALDLLIKEQKVQISERDKRKVFSAVQKPPLNKQAGPRPSR